MVACRATLDALGGHYVLNSGTFLGPSQKLVGYIDLLLEEFKHRWHCMRQHGSDQAIHNVLVYTGKLIGTGEQNKFYAHNSLCNSLAGCIQSTGLH